MPCEHNCKGCTREKAEPHETVGEGHTALFSIYPSCHPQWSHDMRYVKGSPPSPPQQKMEKRV